MTHGLKAIERVCCSIPILKSFIRCSTRLSYRPVYIWYFICFATNSLQICEISFVARGWIEQAVTFLWWIRGNLLWTFLSESINASCPTTRRPRYFWKDDEIRTHARGFIVGQRLLFVSLTENMQYAALPLSYILYLCNGERNRTSQNHRGKKTNTMEPLDFRHRWLKTVRFYR